MFVLFSISNNTTTPEPQESRSTLSNISIPTGGMGEKIITPHFPMLLILVLRCFLVTALSVEDGLS